MSDNGRPRPTQIRSRLRRSMIDADGHGLEYGPVFSEQIPKVGGDEAEEEGRREGYVVEYPSHFARSSGRCALPNPDVP